MKVKRITQLRERSGRTQFRLGADADVNPTHVSAIERGREVPAPDSVVLRRLAAALDFDGDPADLLTEAVETRARA